MTVTQYIGARYVPLFADPIQWDTTKEYEPLTIVLYEGNSYTSRQAVPAGISITNEIYWAQTGNYNAQVEQYRTEVRTFDNRITNNEEAIESLQNDIVNLNDNLQELEESLEEETQAREAAINEEAQAREDAINAEAQAREDAIDAEAQELEAAINEEANARKLDNLFSKNVYATYIGDIAIPKNYSKNPQCSATCQDGDGNIYVTCPNNYNGNGDVHIFTQTGQLIRKISNVPIGHANSIVWNEGNNKIVVSCLNTSNEGSSTATTNIVEITPITGAYTVKDIGSRYYGLTYDHITKKLYGVEMHTTDTNGIVYELDQSTYQQIGIVYRFTHPNSHNFGQSTQPQDAAINDGTIIILYTEGTAYYDKMVNDNDVHTLSNSAKFIAENELWIMGETEGIEFNNNGELLGSCNYYLNSITAGFVVLWAINGNIDVNAWPNYSLHGTGYLKNRTNLVPENFYTMQSVEMLEISKITGLGSLTISDGVNFTEPGTVYPHRITKNIEIYNAGTFRFYQLEPINGLFFLRNAGTLISTSSEAAVDYTSRPTCVTFDNRGTVSAAASRFFNCGYNKAPLTIGSLSGAALTVNNTALEGSSIYIGDHKTNA